MRACIGPILPGGRAGQEHSTHLTTLASRQGDGGDVNTFEGIMGRSNIIPRNKERQFDLSELFFSVTDHKGHILVGNDIFTRISGYTREELIGQPHSIIRHPDVPRAVFKLLWDYLEAGKTIAAYVKNMAKDGCYFWVIALVMPCPGGYLSVRMKPISPIFELAKEVYADILAVEKRIETDPKSKKVAMAAGVARMAELLWRNCWRATTSVTTTNSCGWRYAPRWRHESKL